MTKALIICLTAAVVLGCIPGAPAHAGAPQTHDGFFLRLSAGGGTAGSKIEVPGGGTAGTASVDLSGTAGDVNIAIGGMVQPNLAVHGTIFGWAISDPDAEIFIPGLGTGKGTLSGTATMSAIGPGLTYYFMPVNMYLSGSVGIAKIKLTGRVETETKSGIAVDLTLGKEWWTGDNWGLGLAGGFTYHSVPDNDVSENWSGASFGLRFSATMN